MAEGDTQSKSSENVPHEPSLTARAATLHTYKQDMRDLVKSRKISLVKAFAEQSDTRRKDNSAIPKRSNTVPVLLLVLSLALLALGGLAIFVAHKAYVLREQAREQEKRAVLSDDKLIFVEYSMNFKLQGHLKREFLGALTRMMRKNRATLGSVTEVTISETKWSDAVGDKVTRTYNAPAFLRFIGATLPDSFYRTLRPQFMLGFHVVDRNTPFLLLKVDSYDTALDGMLMWEKRAERELSPLFAIDDKIVGARTVDNVVIQNVDARVLRDDDKKIRFAYTFIDKHTLLITNNIYTLTEITRRYKMRKASASALVQ